MSAEYYSSRAITKEEVLEHVASGSLLVVDKSPSGMGKWCGLIGLPQNEDRRATVWCWDLGDFVIFEVYAGQRDARVAIFREVARLFNCAILHEHYDEYFSAKGSHYTSQRWGADALALWDAAAAYRLPDPRNRRDG